MNTGSSKMAVIRITERFVRNRARVAEGLAGLEDYSSRPYRLRRLTPREVIEKIERLRRQRWTGKPIAADAGVSPATVSPIPHRRG